MAVSGNQPLSPQIQAPGFLNSSEFLACLRLDQEYVPTPGSGGFPQNQREFQDPKMEVLYHIRLYFVGIFPYIGLT